MRPKTTGRFNTRREFIERVHWMWTSTSCNMTTIGRNCRVSVATVSNMINSHGWKKHDDWRVVDLGDYELCMEPEIDDGLYLPENEYFDVDVNLDPMSHATCGHGYMPDAHMLHIPDRIKRDLDLI